MRRRNDAGPFLIVLEAQLLKFGYVLTAAFFLLLVQVRSSLSHMSCYKMCAPSLLWEKFLHPRVTRRGY
jgi:hypothetical protein